MKNNTLIVIATIFTALLLGLIAYQDSIIERSKDIINHIDTTTSVKHDTIWKDTTITETKFVPKYITKIKTDTLYKSNGDTVQLVTESKRFDKRLTIDKDTADVQVYTSGINTSLDSLKMSLKTHKEIITKEVEITKYVKQPKTFKDRFHISPQVGVGYGFINKKVDVYAGIGLSFDL